MNDRVLPAEWAPQSGVMLTWPHADSDWAPYLTDVEPVFAAIATAIAGYEKVLIVTRNETHQTHVHALLQANHCDLSQVRFGRAASNDTWARDHGPITVLENGRPLLLDFVFNGWGGKYPAEQDNQITTQLHAQGLFGQTPRQPQDFVLEGGSIESDGNGTLLTTSACLLTPTRNPAYSRADIEALLQRELGVTHVLWLNHGYLAGDDTDSHIDMLARLCSPDTIAYVQCDRQDDEHYAALRDMEAELQEFRQADGKPYRLIPLPLPEAVYNAKGDRLPASYANFLIINGAVLLPLYDDAQDARAISQLQQAFPEHRIIGIQCRPIIQQYGSLHCLTMQLPAGVLA